MRGQLQSRGLSLSSPDWIGLISSRTAEGLSIPQPASELRWSKSFWMRARISMHSLSAGPLCTPRALGSTMRWFDFYSPVGQTSTLNQQVDKPQPSYLPDIEERLSN